MAGVIKRMIDSIVEQRAEGNATIALTVQTKLVLKGVNPDKFNASSPDDPAVIAKLRTIAAETDMAAAKSAAHTFIALAAPPPVLSGESPDSRGPWAELCRD